jgi:hypothetical protein
MSFKPRSTERCVCSRRVRGMCVVAGYRTGAPVNTSKPRPWLPTAMAVMTRLRNSHSARSGLIGSMPMPMRWRTCGSSRLTSSKATGSRSAPSSGSGLQTVDVPVPAVELPAGVVPQVGVVKVVALPPVGFGEQRGHVDQLAGPHLGVGAHTRLAAVGRWGGHHGTMCSRARRRAGRQGRSARRPGARPSRRARVAGRTSPALASAWVSSNATASRSGLWKDGIERCPSASGEWSPRQRHSPS